MEAKPWETPSFLNSNDSPELPSDLDGVLQFVTLLKHANEWHRRVWKRDFPGNDQQIDCAIDQRLKRLDLVARSIENFREGVKRDSNKDEQERFFFMTLMTGIAINQEHFSWMFNAAEKGIAREKGQLEARQKNKKDWAELQACAQIALEAVEGDNEHDSKEKLYTAAGQLMDPPVSASTFRNYLKGKRR